MKIIITLAMAFAFQLTGLASELFIRIDATGEYYVTVSDQMHQNKNNIYRFSDLPGGVVSIVVINKYTNSILYNGTLSLRHNERVIAQINSFGKFSIIDKVQIRELDWYTTIVVNDSYLETPYPGNTNNTGNQTNNNAYYQFLGAFKSETMDSNKLKMAKNYVSNNSLTAEQIAAISRGFSFDSNRLEFAKHAYATCYDKHNYFLLKETFSFSSNYNSLLKYIGE